MYSVYSLADVATTLNHPDVGRSVLSDAGGGRVTISYSGDLSSHTTTATGYVVINRLKATNGQIGLEVPQNSEADLFLRKWVSYLQNVKNTARFALSTFVLEDPAGHKTLSMSGVTPQKKPDEGYDQTSGNRQYNLLFAEMVETTK